jgi:hypothetical protein
MQTILLALCLAFATVPAFPVPQVRHQTVSGRVVAYGAGNALTCLNGNAYWSMVIRVQRPADVESEFILVPFSLPCGKSVPQWLSAKPELRRFRLFRMKDRDAVLDEFMSMTDATTNKPISDLPIWTYPARAQRERLPFGQVVRF